MNPDIAIRNAQVYRFLADALIYPQYNWLENLASLNRIFHELGLPELEVNANPVDLPSLQSEHRQIFGLTGSLCYETEFGLPHEFRQVQELADITGFYQAFGFKLGGSVRERPDHIAVEVEFMHLLALKEAYAISNGTKEQVETCIDGQKNFLKEHLGRWIGLFSQAVCLNQNNQGSEMPYFEAEKDVYPKIVTCAAAFVEYHAKNLGLKIEPPQLSEVRPTPLGADLSCGECQVA
ncbi:MAG: TorD/DmsD family molecular chaperone, partial [Anaerolineales bacterium]